MGALRRQAGRNVVRHNGEATEKEQENAVGIDTALQKSFFYGHQSAAKQTSFHHCGYFLSDPEGDTIGLLSFALQKAMQAAVRECLARLTISRQITADGTVKDQIDADMSDVPGLIIDVEDDVPDADGAEK